MPGTIAAIEEDTYRALLTFATEGLSSVADVHETNVNESTIGVPTWFVVHLLSMIPNDQRNGEFLATGTVRVRCRFKVARAGASVDPRAGWRLVRAVKDLFRGADLAVLDDTTGNGRAKIGVLSFGEVEANALDPVEGIGEILTQVPYLLTGLPT